MAIGLYRKRLLKPLPLRSSTFKSHTRYKRYKSLQYKLNTQQNSNSQLTFVKFGTYKWVLIVSLYGAASCWWPASPFPWPLSASMLSIASNMGTSLKLGGLSVIKPVNNSRTINKMNGMGLHEGLTHSQLMTRRLSHLVS